MADGDDVFVPVVTADRLKGGPSLQSINEVVRLIFYLLSALEGRTGVIQLRDAVSIIGRITEPPVSETGWATVYYDSLLDKLRVSKNGAAYVDII